MYIMLLPSCEVHNIPPDQFRRQLEREYEIQIDTDREFAVDPPTPEEEKRALSSALVTQMARMPQERWARFRVTISSTYAKVATGL